MKEEQEIELRYAIYYYIRIDK